MHHILSHRLADRSPAHREAGQDAAGRAWHAHFAKAADVRHRVEQHHRLVVHFDADPGDVGALSREHARRATADDVIVEPNMPHVHHHPRLLHPFAAQGPPPPTAGPQAEAAPAAVTVHVTGGGAPLAGAEVNVVVTDAAGTPTTADGVTGDDGRARVSVPEGTTPVLVYVVPRAGFWSMHAQPAAGEVVVDCPALPRNGPLGWWHRVSGIERFEPERGAGIRIGVVDTGCGPSPVLAHVEDAGAFLQGRRSGDGADVGHHGTLVAGLIGARPVERGQYAGTAPGATILSTRVYETANGSANQGDVALAIDALAHDHDVDLVNLSLYSTQPSEIERDAIRAATQAGALCVCASGNNGGAVGYPAAFGETVAVSGLGQIGQAPEGVVDSLFVPQQPDRMGTDGLYLAVFSNHGEGLAAAAPAVATLAPVPVAGSDFQYIAESGTSCAVPILCGVLAGALAGDAGYRTLGRTQERADAARELLWARSRAVGLPADLVGRGLVVSG